MISTVMKQEQAMNALTSPRRRRGSRGERADRRSIPMLAERRLAPVGAVGAAILLCIVSLVFVAPWTALVPAALLVGWLQTGSL